MNEFKRGRDLKFLYNNVKPGIIDRDWIRFKYCFRLTNYFHFIVTNVQGMPKLQPGHIPDI